jgi:hypothetical protein
MRQHSSPRDGAAQPHVARPEFRYSERMRKLNPEIALGFAVATIFWISVLAWQSSETTISSEFFSAKLTDWLLAALTFFLVVFTYRLWRSTDKLWVAGEKQIAVARDSADAAKEAADAARDQTLNFAKLERPYLYIFNARGLNIDHDQEDPFHFLNYSVANYGKTPALVETASIGINVGVAPKQPDAVVGWHDFLVSPLFVTGERRDNPTESIPDDIGIGEYADENTGPFPVPELEGEDEFFFWIKIKYSGPFSKDHETSACWRWDSNSHRLVLYDKHNSQT